MAEIDVEEDWDLEFQETSRLKTAETTQHQSSASIEKMKKENSEDDQPKNFAFKQIVVDDDDDDDDVDDDDDLDWGSEFDSKESSVASSSSSSKTENNKNSISTSSTINAFRSLLTSELVCLPFIQLLKLSTSISFSKKNKKKKTQKIETEKTNATTTTSNNNLGIAGGNSAPTIDPEEEKLFPSKFRLFFDQIQHQNHSSNNLLEQAQSPKHARAVDAELESWLTSVANKHRTSLEGKPEYRIITLKEKTEQALIDSLAIELEYVDKYSVAWAQKFHEHCTVLFRFGTKETSRACWRLIVDFFAQLALAKKNETIDDEDNSERLCELIFSLKFFAQSFFSQNCFLFSSSFVQSCG